MSIFARRNCEFVILPSSTRFSPQGVCRLLNPSPTPFEDSVGNHRTGTHCFPDYASQDCNWAKTDEWVMSDQWILNSVDCRFNCFLGGIRSSWAAMGVRRGIDCDERGSSALA